MTIRRRNCASGETMTEKNLTGNRLVNSIDTALDLGNDDPFVLPDNNFETVTGYLGPKSKHTTQKVLWTNDIHRVIQLPEVFRQFAVTQNIVSQYEMHLSYS